MLPSGHRITREDLVETLARQRVVLREGDVVLVRTGRMKVFEDAAAYMDNPPGIGMSAARFLAEESGAMIIGADNLSLEAFPSEVESNYVPVHTYLLAQQGVPILEVVNLEELSRDQVYEFAFLGGSLKLRGADGAPIRCDDGLRDDAVCTNQGLELRKSSLGRSWRLGPIALYEREPAGRRDEKINLAPMVVAAEVDLAATTLIGIVTDNLAQNVGLEERTEYRPNIPLEIRGQIVTVEPLRVEYPGISIASRRPVAVRFRRLPWPRHLLGRLRQVSNLTVVPGGVSPR
jgi:hypothetical protein